MRYLLPFEAIQRSVRIATERGQLSVNTSYDNFIEIVKALLTAVEVDETWYTQQYPDIGRAIADGTIESARWHFVNHGYKEGRLPFRIEVDEDWYLENNPDVAEGVASGQIASGQRHFEDDGYREGRRPFPT